MLYTSEMFDLRTSVCIFCNFKKPYKLENNGCHIFCVFLWDFIERVMVQVTWEREKGFNLILQTFLKNNRIS